MVVAATHYISSGSACRKAHMHVCAHAHMPSLRAVTRQYGKWQQIQGHAHRKDENPVSAGRRILLLAQVLDPPPPPSPPQKHIQEHKHSPLSWGMKPAQRACASRWLSHGAGEQ